MDHKKEISLIVVRHIIGALAVIFCLTPGAAANPFDPLHDPGEKKAPGLLVGAGLRQYDQRDFPERGQGFRYTGSEYFLGVAPVSWLELLAAVSYLDTKLYGAERISLWQAGDPRFGAAFSHDFAEDKSLGLAVAVTLPSKRWRKAATAHPEYLEWRAEHIFEAAFLFGWRVRDWLKLSALTGYREAELLPGSSTPSRVRAALDANRLPRPYLEGTLAFPGFPSRVLAPFVSLHAEVGLKPSLLETIGVGIVPFLALHNRVLNQLEARAGVEFGPSGGGRDFAPHPLYLFRGALVWRIGPLHKADTSPETQPSPTTSSVSSEAEKSPCPEQRSCVAGRIGEEETGRPIGGARVIIGEDSSASDARGFFRIESKQIGRLLLSVSAEGYKSRFEPVMLQRGEITEQDFTLARIPEIAGTISGRIMSEGGQPLAGFISSPDDPGILFAVDAQGNYQGLLKPGKWRLQAVAEGFIPALAEVTVANAQAIKLNFQLTAIQSAAAPSARIEAGRISIAERIHFDFDSARIRPESFGVLNSVAALLAAHPEISRVRIEGHTDEAGSDDYNVKLSEQRAQSVRDYLISMGVDAGRLDAAGFGKQRPLSVGSSEENRALNRRVEFIILDTR